MELIELYKRLLEEFKKGDNSYICNAINDLDLIFFEESILREHFFTQLPSEIQFVEFYNEPSFNKNIRFIESGTWFKYTNDSIIDITQSKSLLISSEPFLLRIKLLEAIINNLENTCVED